VKKMKKRRLGKTLLEITPIGLGCWQFSQGVGFSGRIWDPLPDQAIRGVVQEALKGGVNWFDTAEAYGNGTSEKKLTEALAALKVSPGSVVIATKWQPLLRTAKSISSNVARRNFCLGRYPIDLYQVHNPWSFSPIHAQMKEMAKLLRAGRIRAVGVSNFSAKQMQAAHDALAAEGVLLASNQVRFSLLQRQIERNGVLDTAKRLGVTIIAWSPLAQGILTGRFHEDPGAVKKVSGLRRMMSRIGPKWIERTRPLIEELSAIARANGVSPSEVALSWEVSFHGETVVAIPGASRPYQAQQAAAAGELRLSARELSGIERLAHFS
jgi:aryl-alcohol dehydrogenase-like predicted oxidoreductase